MGAYATLFERHVTVPTLCGTSTSPREEVWLHKSSSLVRHQVSLQMVSKPLSRVSALTLHTGATKQFRCGSPKQTWMGVVACLMSLRGPAVNWGKRSRLWLLPRAQELNSACCLSPADERHRPVPGAPILSQAEVFMSASHHSKQAIRTGSTDRDERCPL